MPTLERQRLRFAGNPLSFAAPQNLLTNATAKLWSGSAAQVEVALLDGTAIADISNIDFITFEIKTPGANNAAPAASATPLVQKIVESGDLNAALTTEEWATKAADKYHALFTLSDAEANHTGQKWILCYATTVAGNTITLFAGLMEFVADGGPSTTTPDPVTEDAWTKAESDARYQRRGIGTPDTRLDITVLTGGTGTALDSIATEDLTPPYLVAVVITGTLRFYRLTAGTDAEALPGTIRPDDYAPSTNEKIWKQVL
jgi:hypothetical protein